MLEIVRTDRTFIENQADRKENKSVKVRVTVKVRRACKQKSISGRTPLVAEPKLVVTIGHPDLNIKGINPTFEFK